MPGLTFKPIKVTGEVLDKLSSRGDRDPGFETLRSSSTPKPHQTEPRLDDSGDYGVKPYPHSFDDVGTYSTMDSPGQGRRATPMSRPLWVKPIDKRALDRAHSERNLGYEDRKQQQKESKPMPISPPRNIMAKADRGGKYKGSPRGSPVARSDFLQAFLKADFDTDSSSLATDTP